MTVKEYIGYFQSGRYAVCVLDGDDFKQQHFDISDVTAFEQASGKADTFMSLNSFKRYRHSSNIDKLNMLYVDLDLPEGLTKEAALYLLENDYFEVSIPTPSFILDSGRGLWLQWLLEGEDRSSLEKWKSITLQLCRHLKSFGADSRCAEPARICRIPGTVNSKNGVTVAVIGGSRDKYSLDAFTEGYDFDSEPDTEETVVEKKDIGKSKKDGVYTAVNAIASGSGRSRYILMNSRLLDLYRICDYLQWDLGDRVRKEITLFLARYWALELGYSDDEALSFTLNFNSHFVKPLSEDYVRIRTESARRASRSRGKVMYNYKNETLVELLGISEIESELHLQSIKSKKESKRRKKEANRAAYAKRRGKHSKKDKVKIRRQNVAVLVSRGYTLKHICSRLGISRASCYADIKAAKALIEALEAKKKVSPKNSAGKLYNIISSCFTLMQSPILLEDKPADTVAETVFSPPFLLWLQEDRKRQCRIIA